MGSKLKEGLGYKIGKNEERDDTIIIAMISLDIVVASLATASMITIIYRFIYQNYAHIYTSCTFHPIADRGQSCIGFVEAGIDKFDSRTKEARESHSHH